MKSRFQLALLALLLAAPTAICAACGYGGTETAPSAAADSPQPTEASAAYTRFNRVEMDIFDTVVQLTGFSPDQQTFQDAADGVMALLRRYHQLFDGYNEYEGLHNLRYVNLHAAESPVEVPEELFDLLAWCKTRWEEGNTKTNIAMGAVLSIWHTYRTAGANDPAHAQLPPMDALETAAQHVDIENLVLDSEKKTVFFTDPLLQLDVGAVAKGYAADAANEYLSKVLPSYLLSLGGNVYAGEAPMDGRDNWGVGIQDPRVSSESLTQSESNILDVLDLHGLTVVTSGDYWRYYEVDGKRYHHIIDPDTLFPSTQMLSVTVVCRSSLLADYLSTTLFILPYEDGLALVSGLSDVEVLWVLPDQSIRMTDGMTGYLRSMK